MNFAKTKLVNKMFQNFINTPQATLQETNILLKASLEKEVSLFRISKFLTRKQKENMET